MLCWLFCVSAICVGSVYLPLFWKVISAIFVSIVSICDLCMLVFCNCDMCQLLVKIKHVLVGSL